MRLSKILVPATVLTDLKAASKKAAIEALVRALAGVRDVDCDVALRDIAARERTGATLFATGPHGVAVPHALTEACKQLSVAVGVSREGVPWGPGAPRRAHLLVLLLCPPQAQPLYLRVLSRVASLFGNPEAAERMLASASPAAVLRVLDEAEAPLGDIREAKGMPRFCVLGAGHGGMAMAGHLGILGCPVALFNRSPERIRPVQDRGGIDVTGAVDGFASLRVATSDAAEALAQADILMVVVPATGHRDIAETVAPHLRDGHVLVLNPGRTGGALEVARILRDKAPAVHVFIAEAQTLLYASRMTNPGQVHIFSIKNSVPLATLPAYHAADVLPIIRRVLPQFVPGDNVLKTGLDNIGAVFHPAITILNAARIEDTLGDFEYYVEGVTPAVASVLEATDRERVAVAAALGIRANTAREWLYLAYDAAGKTLLDAMRANRGYRGIQAPPTIQHRYISEDVPTSLVPIASLGEMLGVPTPTIRGLIHFASLMDGVDYWAEGRTVDRLGLAGLSVKEIRLLVVGAKAAPASPPAGAPPPGA